MQYPAEVKIQSDFEQVGTQTQWLVLLFCCQMLFDSSRSNDSLSAVCALFGSGLRLPKIKCHHHLEHIEVE